MYRYVIAISVVSALKLNEKEHSGFFRGLFGGSTNSATEITSVENANPVVAGFQSLIEQGKLLIKSIGSEASEENKALLHVSLSQFNYANVIVQGLLDFVNAMRLFSGKVSAIDITGYAERQCLLAYKYVIMLKDNGIAGATDLVSQISALKDEFAKVKSPRDAINLASQAVTALAVFAKTNAAYLSHLTGFSVLADSLSSSITPLVEWSSKAITDMKKISSSMLTISREQFDQMVKTIGSCLETTRNNLFVVIPGEALAKFGKALESVKSKLPRSIQDGIARITGAYKDGKYDDPAGDEAGTCKIATGELKHVKISKSCAPQKLRQKLVNYTGYVGTTFAVENNNVRVRLDYDTEGKQQFYTGLSAAAWLNLNYDFDCKCLQLESQP